LQDKREVIWTTEMLSELHTLRAKGHPTIDCADRLGVCPVTCGKKMRELGLNRRLNKGRHPGARVLSEAPYAAD
jgi:hypothetical protein